MFQDRERLLRLAEEELARRERDDPLAYGYTPHAFQVLAHQDNHDILIVLGGNRSGKSHFAMAEALDVVLERQRWKRHRSVKHGLGPVVWYIMPSIPTFKRAIEPKFWAMVPRKYLLDWNKQDKVATFRTELGHVGKLHFLSAEMRQIRLQGASVDLVVMDETPDEDVFKEANIRLVDRKGRMIMVFSPIDIRSYWVRDKLIIPAQIGERKDIDIKGIPVADEEGKVIVPHLDQEDVDRMFRQYPDPADREARIYGRFTSRQGLVFKQFRPEVHLLPRFKVPEMWSRFWVVDPQYHRFAALQFAVDDKGTYYVTDEYFSQDETLSVRATRIWAITVEMNKPDRSLPVYVDSANPQDIAELNYHFRKVGAKLGAIPLPMQKQIHKMLLRTQSLMEPDDEREYPPEAGPATKGIFGAPRLFIFEDLFSSWMLADRRMASSRLLWEMTHLAWGAHDKPEKKSADGADCADCFIYGTSILSKGFMEKDPLAWTKGLSEADLIIRMAEKRMETLERLNWPGFDRL